MRKNLVLLAAIAVMSGAATAGVVVDDDTQALPNDTDITLNLTKFDGSIGTLTNVYVQLELRLYGAQVQLDNDSANAQNGTARVINTANTLTSSVNLLKTNFDTINNGDLAINAGQVFSLSATSGDAVGSFNVTGLGDYALWQPGTISSSDQGDIASTVWGQYVGTGDFTITVNTTYLTSATFEGENGFFEGNTPTGEIYAYVQYDYEIIPEPMTMTLLGLGSLVLLRRKK